MLAKHREGIKHMVKIVVQVTGTDGNVFALIGLVSRALKDAGQRDEAAEMAHWVMGAGSYDEALTIMREYVDLV